MKKFTMTADVSGQPKYSVTCKSHVEMQRHIYPQHAADYWVSEFIHCLCRSTGFQHEKVTFTLITHEGAHVHRLHQYFDAENSEDLIKFWVPIVTKYISEN